MTQHKQEDIDRFMMKLWGLWKQFPGMRFGQLLINIFGSPMLSSKSATPWLGWEDILPYLEKKLDKKIKEWEEYV